VQNESNLDMVWRDQILESRSKVTLLFQGDSITDSERKQKKNEGLGTGYVAMVALWLSALHPEMDVKVLNRGIAGNRVRDLCNRWQKDALDLKPDVVSILIGINDTLGRYFWSNPTSISDFRNDYRLILQRTYESLHCKIILMEPFSIIVSKDQVKFREDLNPKIQVVRELSEEFETLLVPLDKIFDEAAKKREPQFWSRDGFHPTPVGHAIIAQSWLNLMLSTNQSTFG
jgi:lysophospholipase L1-like esterase